MEAITLHEINVTSIMDTLKMHGQFKKAKINAEKFGLNKILNDFYNQYSMGFSSC